MNDGAFVWMDAAKRASVRRSEGVSLDALLARIESLGDRLAELEQERHSASRLLALPLSRYLGAWLRARPVLGPLVAAADALRALPWPSRTSGWRRGSAAS